MRDDDPCGAKARTSLVGIDVTHLAISLIERRLKDAFSGVAFEVHGTPKDLESAVDLARRDKYQFQWWAVSLVDACPYGGKKKGADGGIDGILFFRSDKDKTEKALISVKGGDNVGVGMVRDLIAVVEREKAAVGVLISLALPMRAMEREAMAAGFFEGPFEAVPKIQLITLAEHPADRRRRHLPHRRARKHRQPGPPAVGSYNSEESINYWSCRQRQAKARTNGHHDTRGRSSQRDCSSLRSSQ
ncbi:MAG: restriction endonuclease [Stellaceae bacterium]